MPLLELKGGLVFVAACIALVTLFVVLPLKEPAAAPGSVRAAGLASAGREMRNFAVEAFRSFVGTRGAWSGLWFSLLPPGAVGLGLGLGLQSNLSVEVGMDDHSVAWLTMWSSVISAGCMVFGGWLSDRWGRRRMLGLYFALMSLPVFYLMSALLEHQWIFPVAADLRRAAPAALVTAVWVATLLYSVAQGLMYGTRSAIMMDVTNPAVAATQFTAYMAMSNLVIAYSATWQGIAIEALGYPKTLLIDGVIGLICLGVLPFIRPSATPAGDGGGARRARRLALVLATCCVAWLPYRAGAFDAGAAAPIFETLFTLVFVATAVFLAAGAATLGSSARLAGRLGLVLAPLLLAMYARRWWPQLDLFYFAAPVAAALVLMVLARQPWLVLRIDKSALA
jgi:PAT family beta-lactamase induction signal transducer AmpG